MDCVTCAELRNRRLQASRAHQRSIEYLRTAKGTPGYPVALEKSEKSKRESQIAALAFMSHRAEHERGHRQISSYGASSAEASIGRSR